MDDPHIFSYLASATDFSVFDIKWIPETAKFIAIGGNAKSSGCIQVFELNDGKLSSAHKSHPSDTLRCASFGLSGTVQTLLSVGDFSGNLSILDVGSTGMSIYHVENAHQGVINAIDSIGSKKGHGSSEIVTGGKDGCVKVWDPRQYSIPVVKMEPVEDVPSRDCWAVAFGNAYNNDERCVFAGFDNGDVKMFDLRNMRTSWETNVQNSVCHIETQNKYCETSELAVSTTNGGLNVFTNIGEHFSQIPTISMKKADISTINYQSYIDTVWAVKYLPQNNNFIATCGGSGIIRLWRRSEIRKLNGFMGNDELKLIDEALINNVGVNCLDWCPGYAGLGVCGSYNKQIAVFATANMQENI